MTYFDPMAYATRGMLTSEGFMDAHGLATGGIIVEEVLIVLRFGGGDDASKDSRKDRKRKDRVKETNEEVLMIIDLFMKVWQGH